MKRGEATTEDNSQQLLLVASRRSSRGFNSTREETSQQGVKGANGDSWECLFLNQHSQDPRWKIEREFEANLEMNAAAGAEEARQEEQQEINNNAGGGAGSARKRKDVAPTITLSRSDWEEMLRMEKLLKGMVRVLSGKLRNYEEVDADLQEEVDTILASTSERKRARVVNDKEEDDDIMAVWGA